MKTIRIVRLIHALCFLLLMGLARGQAPVLISGRYLSQPRVVQPFEMTDIHHQSFGVDQLKGHWTLMYFGFTRCQHKCPVSFSALKGMYAELQQQKLSGSLMPQVVFVSVDPYRDTLGDITDFVRSYQHSFTGLSGDLSHVLALSNQLDVSFHVMHPGSINYSITHSAEVAAINPRGEVVAFFSYPQHPEALATDYRTVVGSLA